VLGIKVCENCECQCFVVDLFWRTSRTVGLPVQPFVDALLRLLGLPDIVVSVFFRYVNVKLLHRNMILKRDTQSDRRCDERERRPEGQIPSAGNKFQDFAPTYSSMIVHDLLLLLVFSFTYAALA
jgi:hypothetical protein